MLLSLADVLAFVLPVAFVAGNVLQLPVVVNMLLADQLGGSADDGVGQPHPARYLKGETRPCLTYRELE